MPVFAPTALGVAGRQALRSLQAKAAGSERSSGTQRHPSAPQPAQHPARDDQRDGARVIETRELQLAEQAVADLVDLDAMGVLYGPAGSGKTFAAALAGRDLAISRVDVPSPDR